MGRLELALHWMSCTHSRRSSSFAESGCVELSSIHCRLCGSGGTEVLAGDGDSEETQRRVRFGTLKERRGRVGGCDHEEQVLQLDG